MKIIVLGPSYEQYSSASYQRNFLETIQKNATKYFHISTKFDLKPGEIINKAGFFPDFILYNHGWFSDDEKDLSLTYGNIRGNWEKYNVKHVLLLNKEYTRLNDKIKAIKEYKFDYVFTHLHNLNKHIEIDFEYHFLPLAYNNFQKIKSKKLCERKYDLFFSGILKNWNFPDLQSDIRLNIQKKLFFTIFDIPILKKFKYWQLNIYWKPFYKNRIKNKISDLLHGKRLSQFNYQKVLENSKVVIHTSSPLGIISTRIFETLGSGSLGLFSSDSNARVLLQDKKNFIEFKDIERLIEILCNLKNNRFINYYQEIATEGERLVKREHTWDNRVAFLKSTLTFLQNRD